MSNSRKSTFWLVVAMLSALVVWSSPEAIAGDRLAAWIDEPFEVNGEIYPAAKLSLKQVSSLSPVAQLHEVRVDGQSRGLLLVRENRSGSAALRGELTFVRAGDGHLVLESIAVAGSPAGTVSSYSSADGQWYASNAPYRTTEGALSR